MRPEPRVTPFPLDFSPCSTLLVRRYPLADALDVGRSNTGPRCESMASHTIRPRENPVTPRLRPFNLDLSDPDVQRRIKIVEAREWAVAALNMPGGLPDMTYAILSPAP